MLGRSPIATKLMPVNAENYKEITINSHITKNILKKGLSRHFLLTYKAFECNKVNSRLPKIIMKSSRYYICLNELAHGDLAVLCKNEDFLHNNELVTNVAIQCILSILSFHRLGYIHNDCHWGNFLYHMTEDVTGYYHYIVYGKNLYLKNCGYTMMIYDFGYAEKYTPLKHNLIQSFIDDYTRPMQAFMNKMYFGWCKFKDLPNDIISDYMSNFNTKVRRSLPTVNDEKSLFVNVIIPLLLKMPYKVLHSTLPSGCTVINSSPYIIDENLSYIE